MERFIKLLFLIYIMQIVAFTAVVEADALQLADDKKLYWFVPDGLRADPEVFDIFKWANEGKLPNIKQMMEKGSYGFQFLCIHRMR